MECVREVCTWLYTVTASLASKASTKGLRREREIEIEKRGMMRDDEMN